MHSYHASISYTATDCNVLHMVLLHEYYRRLDVRKFGFHNRITGKRHPLPDASVFVTITFCQIVLLKILCMYVCMLVLTTLLHSFKSHFSKELEPKTKRNIS